MRAVVVIVSLTAATAGPCGAQPVDRQEYEFHFGGTASASRTTFSRGVETVSPLGEAVGRDELRFDRERLFAGVSRDERVLNFGFDIIAGGKTASGASVVVGWRSANDDTYVYLDDDFSSPALRYQPSHPSGRSDFLNGARVDRVYRPIAMQVCHGLLVVQLVVERDFGQGWQAQGIALATVNLGAWIGGTASPALVPMVRPSDGSEIPDDSEDPIEPGNPRGEVWALSPYATPWFRGDDTPGEVWFGASAYQSKTGGDKVDRAYLFRARRAGDSWSADRCVYFDVAGSNHMHAAFVTTGLNDEMLLGASMGDTPENNRIVLRRCLDPEAYDAVGGGHYLNWAEPHTVYGGAPPDGPGESDSQGFGYIQHPIDRHAVLYGSDAPGPFIIAQMGFSSEEARPSVSWVWGGKVATTDKANNNPYWVFILRPLTPERPGPVVCRINASDLTRAGRTARAVGFSPDGGQTWCTAMTPTEIGSEPQWDVCLTNAYIYATAQYGTIRTPIPQTARTRPMLVGGGGRNLVTAGDLVVTPMGADAIVDVDTSPSFVPPPVPPPSLGRMVRVRQAHADSSGRVARVAITEARDWPNSATTALRYWILPNQGTMADSSRCAVRALFTGDSAAIVPGDYEYFDRDGAQWSPHVHVERWTLSSLPAGHRTFQIELMDDPTTPVAAYDDDFYVLIDQVREGDSLGYPTAPGSTGAPNERLIAGGLSLRESASWHVALWGVQPGYGWDAVTATEGSDVPLITLRSSPTRYVTVWSRGRRGIRVSGPGMASADIVGVDLHDDFSFHLVLSHEPGMLTVFASSGGGALRQSSMALPSGETTYSQLRFGSNSLGVVGEMAWAGYTVGPGALTLEDANALLDGLAMDVGCAADVDGDGDADESDFAAFLDLFAAGDARADVDGDGDRDLDDFFAFLDLFALGC